MNGSLFHPVLHGGVSLRLNVVQDEILDLSCISFGQFYLFHGFSPAFLSGTTLSKVFALLSRRHDRNNRFSCFKVVEVLNSFDAGVTLAALPISSFNIRPSGAMAVSMSLMPTLGAEHD
jgi:hypothetical protein